MDFNAESSLKLQQGIGEKLPDPYVDERMNGFFTAAKLLNWDIESDANGDSDFWRRYMYDLFKQGKRIEIWVNFNYDEFRFVSFYCRDYYGNNEEEFCCDNEEKLSEFLEGIMGWLL